MKSNSKRWNLFPILFAFAILTVSYSVQAQDCAVDNIPCVDDAACQAVCPTCYTCVGGVCTANDGVCQTEAGQCREGVCVGAFITPLNPTGCDFSAPAVAGVEGLDDICYTCAPPAVPGVDTCGNGICDVVVGEDCGTCPTDCLIPGFPGACPLSQDELNQQCETIDSNCSNGDICQTGGCADILECQITEAACSGNLSDLCCAAGCQGPPPGQTCDEAGIPFEICDVDCWPLPTCGDGLVENPETCDGNVGIGEDGAPIADGACRDPGAAAQCTFCGDGIVQAEAGEECDGTDNAACGGGICSSSCTCENVCVTGSGGPIDTIRDNCANCNLDVYASSQGWWRDYALFLAILGTLSLVWLLRRRSLES